MEEFDCKQLRLFLYGAYELSISLKIKSAFKNKV